MMRILLANEAKAGGGGVETYLAATAGALSSRGHAVALLHVNPAAQQGPTRIETPESWSVADLGLEPAIARAMDWQPDVVFSHNMGRLDVDEALVARGPVVKMMHGYFGTCVSGQKAFLFPSASACSRTCGPACLALYGPRRCGRLDPREALANYRWASRQRALFERYQSFVVASRHMKAEYVAHGVGEARVHVLPLFAAAPPTPSGRSHERRVDVAFVGRLTPLKGATTLVDAMQKTSRSLGRKVSVVLAGEGPERQSLAASADEYPELELEVTGWLDPQARTDLFARATVLAVPSLWPEPFGLVGLEAGSLGVPAVAFDVGGIAEWLTNGVNGVLVRPAGDVDALGDAMARVLRDPDRRAVLSAGAREAAARLDAATHLTRLERVLDDVRIAVHS
jgi:glycosyltransferase involved in cell wall biosynthesis